MFETMEINNRQKEYRKKISILVVAENQGSDFEHVLKSVYNQTLNKSEYDVYILSAPNSNVDQELIQKYKAKYKKNTKAMDIRHHCLGGMLQAVGTKKIKIRSEYVTVLRGKNTFRNNALESFARMSGDILVLNFSYPNQKHTNHELFKETIIKRKKIFIGRTAGLHHSHEMTTPDTTEFGKAFHERLFDSKTEIPFGEDGTSLVFYSVMLAKSNNVFYYPKSCGILRNNLSWGPTPKEYIKHYQDGLKFLEMNLSKSKFINKLILLRLYWLVKHNNGNVPHVAYNVDFDKIIHDQYRKSLPIIRKWKKKRDIKGIDTIRQYLGDRIIAKEK